MTRGLASNVSRSGGETPWKETLGPATGGRESRVRKHHRNSSDSPERPRNSKPTDSLPRNALGGKKREQAETKVWVGRVAPRAA